MNPFFFYPNFSYYPNPFALFPSGPVQNYVMPQVNAPRTQTEPFEPQELPEPSQQARQIPQKIVEVIKAPPRERGEERIQKKIKIRVSDSIQLQNRNILPNMNNVLLSYVRRISRSGPAVEKVLRAYTEDGQNIAQLVKKFYAYQNYLKNNVNDFIIREAVRAVMSYRNPSISSFSLDEQQFFNRVFRVVVKEYLEDNYLTSILNSEMPESKRRDHLKVRRYMLEMINS